MADSKITALTALTAADPTVDMFPVVDVSDTTMAASGTTKRISINNILACSPSATLASATITGDLTVRTNQLVVNSSGSFVGKSAGAVGTDGVQLLASGFSGFSASGTTALFVNRNTSDGTVLQLGRSGSSAADFGAIAGGGFTVGLSGSEWMRINATGLGVGVASPSYKLDVNGTGKASSGFSVGDSSGNLSGSFVNESDVSKSLTINADPGNAGANSFMQFKVDGSTAMTLNSTGLGVGVASPSNLLEAQEAGTGSGLGGIVSSTATVGGNAGYIFRTGGTNRWSLSLTGSAGAESIRFYDINNSATRMTLDPSGNLLVGTPDAAGSASNSTKTVGGIFSSVNGTSASTASGSAVTLFASQSEATYMVSAYILGTGAPATYNAVAIVKTNAGVATITTISSATNLTISISGLNVQATQTSGVSQVITYNVIRIS